MTTTTNTTAAQRERQLAESLGLTATPDARRGGSWCSYSYTAPSGSEWRVWLNYYNPNRPWRVARLTPFKAVGTIQHTFGTHSGHATLESAAAWLKALD
jgi:hypothetical protein